MDFTIGSAEGDIDYDEGTITIEVPYIADLAHLTPAIALNNGATVSPDTAVEQDFTNPVKYTVTAKNGSTKDYLVTVTLAPAIETFAIGSASGAVDYSAGTIAIEVPYNADLEHLTPIITLNTGATVNPASGEEDDFTEPVIYTVTGANGTSTKTYTVTVTRSPVITEFKIGNATGIIDNGAETIAVTVPYGTSVASLTPTIVHNSTAANPISPDGAQNFGSPVDYTVTAANGSTKTYSVTVTVAPQPPAPTYALTVTGGTDNTNAGPYEEGASVSITAGAAPEGQIFDTWTTSAGGTFADASKESTTFTMPANAVTITATYKDDPNAGNGEPGDDNPPDNPPATDNGWVKNDDGKWEYLTDGEAETGWLYDTNYKAWYYLASDGVMQTGWDYVGGKWYYLASNGKMQTGWLKDNGSWYYLAGSGAMVVSKWFKDTDGSWYYLSGNGKMLTGKQNIGGKAYTFKSNGVWVS
jgi:hypothetical protein